MSEQSKPTRHELEIAIASARESLSLLRSQAQAKSVDPIYLNERLRSIEQLISDTATLRVPTTWVRLQVDRRNGTSRLH